MCSTKIRTPKGKLLTVEQYLALANRNEQPCEHGHLDCAGWNHGPCMDELLSEAEDDLLDRNDDRRDDA